MRALKIAAFAALVAGIAALAASAGAFGATTAVPPTGKIVIGYIDHIDSIPFVQLVRKSIQAEAKQDGVKVIVCYPNGDAQKTVDCAAQFKAQKVNGIISFNPVAAAAARACAAGPKVPVVAIDIQQKPCQTLFFGADNTAAGMLAGAALGQWAKTTLNCKVDAFVLMDDPAVGIVDTERMQGQLHGYESVCGKPPNITYVNGQGTLDTAIQPATDELTRLSGDHHIMVVSLNDDMDEGMIKAAQASNRLNDIYVAGQGADPTSWPFICGKTPFKHWIADTAYFPELYGSHVVPAMISLIEGQPEPKVIYTNHRVVTPQNIRSIYPNACK